MFTKSHYLPDSYFEKPEELSWPIDRDNCVSVRDNFIEGILNFYKSNPSFSVFIKFYPVLCMYWSAHILQTCSALSLKKADKKDVALVDPIQMAILNDSKIPDPSYLVQLEKGVCDIKPYLKPLRFLKNLFVNNKIIIRRPQFLTNFKNDIIVTTTGPLITLHAQATNENVIYQNQSLWFYPLKEIKDLNYSLADKDAELLWSYVVQYLGEQDIFLTTPSIELWFKSVFQKSLVLCHEYHKRLEQNKRLLPKKLWIGTGSSLWDRILKHAVFNNGGQVTGHDHGAGVGHLISKSRTLAECYACHEFATLGEPELFEATIFKPFLINDPPKAKHIANDKITTLPKIKTRNGNKVLIMPSAPESKIPRFIGASMEVVQADFLNRLFLELKRNGYDVYIKPHPELKPLINDEYFIQKGGHVLRGSLNEAYELCDIVVFQHIHTTTFKEAFEAGKHIVFMDMQYDKWTSEAYSAVKKRCSAIPMYYDEQNKIQMEWENLSQFMEDSRTLKNDDFMKMLFS